MSDLWEEYNCRHTYFGIILGISEPQYTKKELKEMQEATVKFNGKEMSYYEGTQKQRQLENAIRKQKRAVQTLEKANVDSTVSKSKLAKLQKQYKDFCKETGLEKDYGRIKVATAKNTNQNYKDITSLYSNTNKYRVQKQQYYIDDNGVKYKVDGKYVKLEPSQRETEVARLLGKTYGGNIKIIPKVSEPVSVKTPDYIINGQKFDLKEIEGNSRNTLDGAIKRQKRQANNFIFDITKTEMRENEAIQQIQKIYQSKHREWINTIVLVEGNKVLKIFKR